MEQFAISDSSLILSPPFRPNILKMKLKTYLFRQRRTTSTLLLCFCETYLLTYWLCSSSGLEMAAISALLAGAIDKCYRHNALLCTVIQNLISPGSSATCRTVLDDDLPYLC